MQWGTLFNGEIGISTILSDRVKFHISEPVIHIFGIFSSFNFVCVKLFPAIFFKNGRFFRIFLIGFDLQCNSIFDVVLQANLRFCAAMGISAISRHLH